MLPAILTNSFRAQISSGSLPSLRGPADYALIARRYAESMRRQNILYAEVTLSIGVMIRRNQDPETQILQRCVMRRAEVPGVKLKYIFDAVRQWGVAPAMEVARIAADYTRRISWPMELAAMN